MVQFRDAHTPGMGETQPEPPLIDELVRCHPLASFAEGCVRRTYPKSVGYAVSIITRSGTRSSSASRRSGSDLS